MIQFVLMQIRRLSTLIKALVFDLDDTLVSEMEFVESGYFTIAQELSKDLQINQAEIFGKLKGEFSKNSKNVFNRVLDSYGIDYDLNYINDLVKIYREHKPTLKGYPNIKDELVKLRAEGFKLGIITDGFEISQKNKIMSLNLYEYVDEIIVTDEFGKDFWKPSVKPFELIKNKLNVDYNEMVYIGDNPNKDFYIKKDYPISTVRIYRPEGVYANDEYLEGVREDYRINNIEELSRIFH